MLQLCGESACKHLIRASVVLIIWPSVRENEVWETEKTEDFIFTLQHLNVSFFPKVASQSGHIDFSDKDVFADIYHFGVHP